MPTYEYGCEACGHQFEREQRITEDAIKKCPECKKDKAKRLITQGNFILKGGGWYADLYHKGGPAKSPVGSTTSSDDKSGGDSKAGGDSKPSNSSSSSSSDSTSPSKSEKPATTTPSSKPKASSSKD